ncbi:hypothetical protein [Synechococcus sp. UW179A]|uniref:hypothetical protein n=1 Tax=Synechococcus sp. UW179A TaxID=2575510 RepID=UPI00352EA97F
MIIGFLWRCWRRGIGVIASLSEPFCGDCNRLRITADGQAFTCLLAPVEQT